MKIARVTSVKLVKEDGSDLHPSTEAKAMELMRGFQQDKVLGPTSAIPDAAALRMVESVMKRFNLIHRRTKD